MSFPLSQEQLELRDTVRAFFAETFGQEKLIMKSSSTTNIDLWPKVLQLGFRESFNPNNQLGTVWGEAELALIAHEVGRALFPEPLLEDIFATHFFLPLVSSDCLAKIEQGESLLYFPSVELNLVNNNVVELPYIVGLRKTSHLWILAPSASSQIVFAPSSAISINQQSTSFDLLTPQSQVSINLAECHKQLITSDQCNRFLAVQQLLAAAQLIGIAERVFEMTHEYVQVRKQFGVEISSFQVIQHKLADQYLVVQSGMALNRFAAQSATSSPEQFPFSALSAVTYAAKNVLGLLESCLQIHGGVGFTWEHSLHFYLRRAQMIAASWSGSSTDLISLALDRRS